MKTGDKIGKWTVEKKAGSGGHGEVYFAVDIHRNKVAIKVLKKNDINNKDLYQRFIDEIKSQMELSVSLNVLPVIESYLPPVPRNNDLPWFAMPRAEPLSKIIPGLNTFRSVVEIINDLVSVVLQLHTKGYSHRDIKPDNIFRYNSKWTLGDFGLVDFPDKSHITTNRSKLGPLYYIAPEMLNNPRESDGKSADIYSIAKLFWKLTSGFTYPIPGQHRCNVAAMTLSYYAQDERAFLLDGLLDRTTSLNPEERLSANEFLEEINYWLNPKVFSMQNYQIPSFKDLSQMIADHNKAQQESNIAKQTEMAHLRNIVNEQFHKIATSFVVDTGLSITPCQGLNPLGYNLDYKPLDFQKQIDRCGANIGLMVHGEHFQERVQVEFTASQFDDDIFTSLIICLCNDGTATPKNIENLFQFHKNIKSKMSNVNELVDEISALVETKIAELLPRLRERIIYNCSKFIEGDLLTTIST